MTTVERPTMVVPADWVVGPPQGQWTYEEYAALPDDGQWYEIVKGILYMAPSPNSGHQRINLDIAVCLHQFIQQTGLGEVFSELDVKLNPATVVRPDVVVVLSEHLDRVKPEHIVGAPDLVVEILSPSTKRHDFGRKCDAYEQAQVPEYWIVDPNERTIEVLTLKNGVYYSLGAFEGKAMLPTRVIPNMQIRVEQFFAFLRKR